MNQRRGVYEIFITFFLVLVLVFGLMFVLFSVVSSTGLYAQVQSASQAPLDALALKDSLFFCHRLEFLDETMMNEPCPAKNMLHGFIVKQSSLNGCEAKEWDYSKPGYSQTTPFAVTVEQEVGTRCLATLEILSGEQT